MKGKSIIGTIILLLLSWILVYFLYAEEVLSIQQGYFDTLDALGLILAIISMILKIGDPLFSLQIWLIIGVIGGILFRNGSKALQSTFFVAVLNTAILIAAVYHYSLNTPFLYDDIVTLFQYVFGQAVWDSVIGGFCGYLCGALFGRILTKKEVFYVKEEDLIPYTQKCPSCGSTILSNAVYCCYCGANLKTSLNHKNEEVE